LFTVVLSPDLPVPTLVGLWIMVLLWLWFSVVALVFAHTHVRYRLLRASAGENDPCAGFRGQRS
jgi:threonine/homoserine/homoserine lactone efflux protein